MKKPGLFTALFILLFCTVAIGQGTSPALQNIVTKFKNYANSHIVEEAYLSFDKPYYAVGDTMYFKAFVVIGERHEVSQASGVLHVDLVDPSDHIVNGRILKLTKGTAAGDFTLIDTLKSGVYRIRAYTRYMQNTPDYFFDKPVMIAGNGSNTENIDTHQSANADIQFFPEGGDLITALTSKVAFKAIGTNGLGIKVKGSIVDNANESVAEFASNDLGMGSFVMKPEEGKTYKAKITFGNSKPTMVNLPAVKPKGITLRAKDTLGKVSVDIVCSKIYLAENANKEVNLFIYSGGVLKQVTAKLDSRDLSMTVPDSQFPSGVLRITLFSQDGEPLSERLVFLKNPDLLNIAVSSDKSSYKARERVLINVAAKSNGAPATGYFAAAVVDETRVPFSDNEQTTILSYLLLNSELKGYIEKPNYYFAQNNSQRIADLDLLMMTQGYRRFTWKQLDDTARFTFPAEKSLFVQGMEKSNSGQPLPNKDLMLLATKTGAMYGAKTDNSGKFTFDNLDYEEGTEFMLQVAGSTKNKSAVNFTLLKADAPIVTEEKMPGGYAAGLQAYSNAAQGAAKNMSGNLVADNELAGSDIGESQSLTEALKKHVADITFSAGAPYLKGNKYPMYVVVDGSVYSSSLNLDKILPSNVSNIKVLKGKNAGAFGANGASGVLIINTRSGSSGNELNTQDNYQTKTTGGARNYPESALEKNKQYRSSNIGGAGHADQVVHNETFRYSPDMSSGLNGVLRGVDFVNGVPFLRGSAVVSNGGEKVAPMYVLLDGSEIQGSINNISPLAIETVEVLKGSSASIYGVQGGNGVLVLTSRQTEEAPVNTSVLSNLSFRGHGFYKAREFYSPKYGVTSSNNGPDLRSTIYWNPNLNTDSGGNGSFEFYNADGRGSYKVIVEGMDAAGNIGWSVYRYKVE